MLKICREPSCNQKKLENVGEVVKPSMEEVLAYAKGNVRNFVLEYAADLPEEHKEEIEQEANMRLIEAYQRLDEDKGWRSFVYNHARGAVLDYLKFGRGFKETNWRLQLVLGKKYVEKLRERVSLVGDDGEAMDVDHTAGLDGIFSGPDVDKLQIRWELLARMSASDIALHAFAKWLRGFAVSEIAKVFRISRARVSQLIQEVIDRFDDPACANDPWFLQTVYALGLSRQMGLEDVDQSTLLGFSIGWSERPVDLDAQPLDENANQMSFFDVG